MKFRHQSSSSDGVELQMTSMIDIVFLLLIFFIMTFKIVSPEGDFNMKMPLETSAGEPPIDLPPITVRLTANSRGELASVQMGSNVLSGTRKEAFDELHQQIRAMVGDKGGPGSVAESTEVEIDCDYDLRFEYVIDAISALSGYVVDDGDRTSIVPLIEKIKFATPRKPE